MDPVSRLNVCYNNIKVGTLAVYKKYLAAFEYDKDYRSGLPMITPTNMDIGEIKDPKSTAYARIYDRIMERCFPVEVDASAAGPPSASAMIICD